MPDMVTHAIEGINYIDKILGNIGLALFICG